MLGSGSDWLFLFHEEVHESSSNFTKQTPFDRRGCKMSLLEHPCSWSPVSNTIVPAFTMAQLQEQLQYDLLGNYWQKNGQDKLVSVRHKGRIRVSVNHAQSLKETNLLVRPLQDLSDSLGHCSGNESAMDHS